ncbi:MULTISPECIES: hypothetical protein [unclassified Streptomyces]|uniref:hypothetical protein n=1 Tax=unclassified Streptomyces TaxID=2593676 RepID=UPI00278BF62A|nr:MULTISPECIES: hypothetical protein [unclassified Streptomyces]
MSFFGDDPALDRWLVSGRILNVGAVPVYWVLLFFFIKEEGWHFSFLVAALLPPIAALLALRGHREVRPGLTAAGMALAVGTLPLMVWLAMLEGR